MADRHPNSERVMGAAWCPGVDGNLLVENFLVDENNIEQDGVEKKRVEEDFIVYL